MARIELSDVMTGLGMLGNVLAIPRQVEAQQTGNEQLRAMLTGTGIPQEQIDAATPEPALRWLSPKQGGFTGKVLGGVGDVGAILSTVIGKPVKAPRLELADLAAANTLRTGYQKQQAQKALEGAIAAGKSNKEIGQLAIAAGNIDAGLRFLHGEDYKPPGSIFAARARLARMAADDPERPALERLIHEDEAAWQRRQEEEDRLVRERANLHYMTPEETERRRHEQIVKDREADAKRLGYTEGSDEWKFFMEHGRGPSETKKRDLTLADFVRQVDRERAARAKDPRYTPPTESSTDEARRRFADYEKGRQAAERGEPPPEAPRPPSRTRYPEAPPTATTVTPTSPSKTATTEAPAADTSDAAADAILGSIDLDSLPPDVQAQVRAAAKAGMPKWPLANWLLSLQPRQ